MENRIPTLDEYILEGKNNINLPDLPINKVWRVLKSFNAASLPWEKYADTWIGKFRKFNINAEGVQQYPKNRAIVIHTNNDFFVSYFYDSSSIMPNPNNNKSFATYYSNKKWDNYTDWLKKLIFMGVEEGFIKMDSMNDDDKISIKWSEIYDAIRDKKYLTINGIEILNYESVDFDFDRGYLKVIGFNLDGIKEETLIRDLLKADIKIS